ncbi:alpha methylacyl-coa racemase, putative [Perkinsus marinus ATCC 50983]|uniref:Alpha methylacyl-coa racemase, putative n=1 Tax=Perkinsus marinus (strain ATCC 50983 / TXsc) TaxID=423536 RepID=C5KK15_PERM5|nr:alpha methylacyl-coa racemase, putative [Perkinsus marinus ATCC 50983]EER15273.1 alpha methylacyl-coa racemase, putative [Perkinsus marinus ATCC 50983]|eukprot:XP_002783477.1 alpha methylacyl-coa racemase, putative [Perkinsus marinus ATCC 50983]
MPTSPSQNPLSALPRGIMENLRVLELATYIAGPGASLIFTELGATTIKVETPSTDGSSAGGDPMRQLLLPFEPGRPHSSIFEMFNRGKESICLDLKLEKDMQLFWELLEDADVFITNVRIDSLCSLGIDHRTVCAQLPSLVYVLMTAWGTKGHGYQKPGVETDRGLRRFWAAMNPWYRARLLNAVSRGGADYLWAKLSPFDHSSMVERLAPLLGYLFDVLESFISNHTLEEMEHLDETHDLWFTRINKPDEACRVEQAHTTGIWGTAADGQKFVTAPFNLSDCPPVRSGVRLSPGPSAVTTSSKL